MAQYLLPYEWANGCSMRNSKTNMSNIIVRRTFIKSIIWQKIKAHLLQRIDPTAITNLGRRPRAAEITCRTLARLRTVAPQLCRDSPRPPQRPIRLNHPTPTDNNSSCASPTFKMRTYDDSFSGQKIYPGKVCLTPLGGRPLNWISANDSTIEPAS